MSKIVISKTFLKKLAKGRVFSISFNDSEGNLKKMSCKFSVKKYVKNLNEEPKADDSVEKRYFTVYKMGRKTKEELELERNKGVNPLAKRYRRISTLRIQSVKVCGVEYSYDELVEMYLDFMASGFVVRKVPMTENGHFSFVHKGDASQTETVTHFTVTKVRETA